MAATKCACFVLMVLLLSWWGSFCSANRDISDRNQQVNKPESFNSGVGAAWSWGHNNAGFGVGQGVGSGGGGYNIGGSFGGDVGSGTGSGSGTGVGFGSGSGSGSGYGFGVGSGGGTGTGSGQGSGTGSGRGCIGGGKGSGTGSGSGSGHGSGGSGSGQGSGIPSFQIPGLPPIPLWGLQCTPIECPAGNCGGIRMFFDHSLHTITSSDSNTNATSLHANQETKIDVANQGINSTREDNGQYLNDKING